MYQYTYLENYLDFSVRLDIKKSSDPKLFETKVVAHT